MYQGLAHHVPSCYSPEGTFQHTTQDEGVKFDLWRFRFNLKIPKEHCDVEMAKRPVPLCTPRRPNKITCRGIKSARSLWGFAATKACLRELTPRRQDATTRHEDQTMTTCPVNSLYTKLQIEWMGLGASLFLVKCSHQGNDTNDDHLSCQLSVHGKPEQSARVLARPCLVNCTHHATRRCLGTPVETTCHLE